MQCSINIFIFDIWWWLWRWNHILEIK